MLLHSRVSIFISLSKEIFLFLENNETTSYFFWRRKRSKKTLFPYFLAQKEAKTSTLTKASPYMERMQTNNRSTPSIISMFWYRGTTRWIIIWLRSPH